MGHLVLHLTVMLSIFPLLPQTCCLEHSQQTLARVPTQAVGLTRLLSVNQPGRSHASRGLSEPLKEEQQNYYEESQPCNKGQCLEQFVCFSVIGQELGRLFKSGNC